MCRDLLFFCFPQVFPIVAEHYDRRQRLFPSARFSGVLEVFIIPSGGPSHSAIITIIDAFTYFSRNICFQSKLVEENVEMLILTFSQSQDSVVQGKRPIFDLFQYRLQHNHIIKPDALLEQIHCVQKNVSVRDQIAP